MLLAPRGWTREDVQKMKDIAKLNPKEKREVH